MNIAAMRREILIVYPAWTQVNRMPENQIVAIYRSLQSRGQFEGRRTRSGKEMGYLAPLPRAPIDDGYHQMTISEYLKGGQDI